MAQLRYPNSSFLGGLISIALIVGLSGCQPEQQSQQPPTPTPIGSPSPKNTEDSQSLAKPELAVYWIAYEGDKLFLEPTKIPLNTLENASPDEQLSSAFKRLLAGSANADKTHAIPETTKLNSLTVSEEGVRIDLSKDFSTGGGSKLMQARLGQIIYTASSLNPQEAVWISVDGEPLEVLSGDGLILSQPMTRKEFDANFSL